MAERVGAVNPMLRGWGQYSRTGNPMEKFSEIDKYVACDKRAVGLDRLTQT